VEKTVKRNITLSLPADMIKAAKLLAAQRETSINAIMADLLRKEIDAERDSYVVSVDAFIARASKIKVKMPPKNERWTRDSLYDD
jgi:hypothetical protein